MRSAWQVRAGRRGERDQESLENGLIILGWEEVPDLAQFQTKNDLKSGLQNQYPQRSAYVLGNWTGQLWRFYHEISEGDLVVMPLKSQRRYAIGEVSGDYHYRTEAKPGYQHVRPSAGFAPTLSRRSSKQTCVAAWGRC